MLQPTVLVKGRLCLPSALSAASCFSNCSARCGMAPRTAYSAARRFGLTVSMLRMGAVRTPFSLPGHIWETFVITDCNKGGGRRTQNAIGWGVGASVLY